jgi:hypothetical protein
MRNLAPNLGSSAVVSAIALLACSGCASSKQASLADSAPPLVDPSRLQGFTAEGSFGHRLELITEPGLFGRASATLARSGETWRVSDEDCPAFRNSIAQFRALPSLKPGPYLLQPEVGQGTPMAPRRNGESWAIRTEIYAPDWSRMDVEIRGGQGPYAAWLSETVEVIKNCGERTGAE